MEMLYLILFFLIVHWFGDFALQTRDMGMKKSGSLYWLTLHVLLYSAVWLNVMSIMHGVYMGTFFASLTFVFHWLTDFITSKWTKRLYNQNHIYGVFGFFSVIGLDQFLHYLQLFLCYQILIGF